jgi:hypothetical protein
MRERSACLRRDRVFANPSPQPSPTRGEGAFLTPSLSRKGRGSLAEWHQDWLRFVGNQVLLKPVYIFRLRCLPVAPCASGQ